MVSIGLTIFPAEAGCSNVRNYQSTAVRFVINDSEILSAQPVDDEVPAEPSMAWFHRKAPSTPKAVGGDFDERAEIRNGKLTVDGREPLVHDPTGTIRLTVTHISLTSRVLPTLDLQLHETEEAIRGIVAGSVRDIHRSAVIRGIATIGRDRIGVLSASRHAPDTLHDSLDIELTAASVDTDELAADLAGIIARENRASRTSELTAPHAPMWVPFRVVIGADSETSGHLYAQGVLPREDFDRLAFDIASDRVTDLALSCRTDLWVRSPTLSPQIWYMAPGKIGTAMIDEIWWSKSYETDIREAKEVAAAPQTQPAKPSSAKRGASGLAAFILIGILLLVVSVTYFGWQWLSLRR